MLHPKNNRIDYGDQLVPPDGYELAHAYGTTYSLDLESLMVLPVALFYAQKIDGNIEDLRFDMLDAITNAANKMTVFYQNGQLKVPKKYHHLMAYWEKGIRPITMSNHASSFHPKVWVVRYEKKDYPPVYRVLVTSRNLTFSRDWDIAISTDGEVTDVEQRKNTPLVHFLTQVIKAGNFEVPKKFINELLRVKFDIPDGFTSLNFAPIGIANPDTEKVYSNPVTAPRASWDEMLVVSPFVDKTTLNVITDATDKEPRILSRKEELDQIDEETLSRCDCWQFSTFFEKAEYYQELEEDEAIPLSQSLHAKLFVAMKDKTPHWYLGSANCTNPATERNIEFMVALKAQSYSHLKTRGTFLSLTEPDRTDGITLFEPYQSDRKDTEEELEKVDRELREIKYQLTKVPIKGSAVKIEGGSAFKLQIQINASKFDLPGNFKVRFRPLPEAKKAPVAIKPKSFNNIDDFEGYSETSLSIFLVFDILHKGVSCSQFLLPMEIELPESRLNKILTSIIDSRDKFMKYLTFLLTGEETNTIGESNDKKTATGNGTQDALLLEQTPIFEKLLIASSRYPEKLKSIETLIQRLKEESEEAEQPIITREFEDFWNVFHSFVQEKFTE